MDGQHWLSSSGQASVELALVVPILFLFFLGTVEFGRMAYVAIETASAARSGAQYGAQNPVTAADAAGMQQAAQQDAPELTRLSVTSKIVCQCAISLGTTAACTSTCASGRLIVYVQVDTVAQFQPWFPYPGAPSSISVKGEALEPLGQ